jgi:hypothetical protein|tara:strand:+ start:457 stop:690 length:234 start_codon:yes stop_codon:yes gene_type:complete
MWKDEIRKSNKSDLPLLDELEDKLTDARMYFLKLITERDANENTIERQVLMDALDSLDECIEIISNDIQETSMEPDF